MKKEEKIELLKLGKALSDDFIDRLIRDDANENATEFEVAGKILKMVSKREVGEEPAPVEQFIPKTTKELFEHLLEGFNEDILNNSSSKEELMRNAEILIDMRKDLKSF